MKKTLFVLFLALLVTAVVSAQTIGENFAAGGLIPGEYQISFWLDKMHQKIVEIEPGKLTVVTVVVE